jgi:hypothetical protein
VDTGLPSASLDKPVNIIAQSSHSIPEFKNISGVVVSFAIEDRKRYSIKAVSFSCGFASIALWDG